jgi:hypothetical protein
LMQPLASADDVGANASAAAKKMAKTLMAGSFDGREQ